MLFRSPYYGQPNIFSNNTTNLGIFRWHVWNIAFYPNGFKRILDALWSEYMLGSVSLFLIPVFIFNVLKKTKDSNLLRILLIGVANLVIYIFLPSAPQDNIIVSVFRYSYPAFIPLILIMFVHAQKYKKEEFIMLAVIINMIVTAEFSYHPKLLIPLLPIALLIYFFKPFRNKILKSKKYLYSLLKKGKYRKLAKF